jgi:predicted P-loop ATPase
VLELSELASLVNAKDREAMLSFITAREDKWRRKYDRMETAIPRHSVIVGTGNRADFISSPDGARRFWPVHVDSHIDTPKLREWRDHLWAEAVHVHQTQGEPARWLSDQALGQLAAADREANWSEHDAWTEQLGDWCTGRREVTGLEAAGRLGIEPAHLTMAAQKRIGQILRSLGYTRVTQRNGGRLRKAWVL